MDLAIRQVILLFIGQLRKVMERNRENQIDRVAIREGLKVYRTPWEYDVEPDAVNSQGSRFYVFRDLSKYLRKDTMGKEIRGLEEAILMRVYDPSTGATDLLLKRGEEIDVLEEQVSYEGLCSYLDVIKVSYKFKEKEECMHTPSD